MENKCKERSRGEAAADGRMFPSLLHLCRLYTDTQQTAEGVKSMQQTSAAATQPSPQSLKKGVQVQGHQFKRRQTGNKISN